MEIDNEIRRKLLKPAVYTLKAVDAHGRILDSAPLVFCDAKAKDKAPPCEMIQMVEKEKKK